MAEPLPPEDLCGPASCLLAKAKAAHVLIATAESCTGGLIAATLTAVAGSSAVFERGFVTYSNEAKIADLGVPATVIELHGAVSGEVAKAMAIGAVANSLADIAVAVTGVAGPGGGSAAKPVGLVHIAVARRSGHVSHRECRFGDIGRREIRRATVKAAFDMLDAAIGRPAQ